MTWKSLRCMSILKRSFAIEAFIILTEVRNLTTVLSLDR
jgi:hypothetical protein